MARLIFNLFDPGMSELHRLGLGALAASCYQMKSEGKLNKEEFKYSKKTLEFESTNLKELLKKIYRYSFQLDKKWSMIRFPGAWNWDVTDKDQEYMSILLVLQESILCSTLPANVGRLSCTETMILDKDQQEAIGRWSFPVGENNHMMSVKRSHVTSLISHTEHLVDQVFSRKDPNVLQESVEINSKIVPGFYERHTAVTGTSIKQDAKQAICLHFYVAGIYTLPLRYTDQMSQSSDFRQIVLFPDVNNLELYVERRQYMNPSRYKDCIVSGGIEAVVNVQIQTYEKYKDEALSAFYVSVYRTIPWMRTLGRSDIRRVDFSQVKPEVMDLLFSVKNYFSPQEVVTEKGSFYSPSVVLPLFLSNIIQEKPWHYGLGQIIVNPTSYFNVHFRERKGFFAMIDQMEVSVERQLVQVLHKSMEANFGMLSEDYQARGNVIQRSQFDPVFFKKIRSLKEQWLFSFNRARDLGSIRQAIMAVVSKPLYNRQLTECWPEVLEYLTTAEDWRTVRDTALLALVSYQGQKNDLPEAEEMETAD